MATASEPAARTRSDRVKLYKGDIGAFMWVLHRITGVLILVFLFAHVVDTATIMWGPDVYNEVVGLYKNTFVLIFFEVPLVGAVIFHALNGLRIIAIDLTAWGVRTQRQLAWGVFSLTALLFVPSAYMMLRHLVGGGH
jgi:succinate dehydrogenase / fumarate reductase cytochrome b subunit